MHWASFVRPVDSAQEEDNISEECAEIALESIEHFAFNTSIHGFKYAFQPRRHFIERYTGN